MARAERAGRRAWPRVEAVAVVVALTLVAAATVGVVGVAVCVVVAAQARRLGGDRWLRTVPVLVGWMAIVVAVDWAAGAAWDRVTDAEPSVSAVTDVSDVDLPGPEDPRADLPAYDGEPWAERYFAEFERLRYGYVPFLGPRAEDLAGRYINTSDGMRRTYTPVPPPGVEPLEVWFFGGSTTWGEGQRDLHTIPSEVTRLAEEAGVYLEPVNMGERGYNAFQELILFEQRLVERGPPDLAVFFDGHNEFGPHLEAAQGPIDQPTVFQYELIAENVEAAPPVPGAPAIGPTNPLEDYVEVSVLHKLWRRLQTLAMVPPAAADDEPVVLTAEQRNAVVEVYGRAVRLIGETADRFGTPVEMFWQPVRPAQARDGALDPDLLPPEVHDLEGAYLDSGVPDRSLFIDGGHTGELGSRLAAEAMWPHLAPVLREVAASR